MCGKVVMNLLTYCVPRFEFCLNVRFYFVQDNTFVQEYTRLICDRDSCSGESYFVFRVSVSTKDD